MKLIKKLLAAALTLVVIASLCACGCSSDTNKLVASDLSGAEVLNEFWNTDLDASAEFLNGYRAQSIEEVTQNWRQAKMQGNGAILYALYAPARKEICLQQMKANFGSWNFYYGVDQSQLPLDILVSTPEKVEDSEMYYALVTTILNDGTTNSYDIYIELVDGGYFVIDEQAPEIVG